MATPDATRASKTNLEYDVEAHSEEAMRAAIEELQKMHQVLLEQYSSNAV